MYRLSRWASTSAVLLTFGLITGAVTPTAISPTASAQETEETTPDGIFAPSSPQTNPTQTPTAQPSANFSDVNSDYWAQPFIQALAAKNIITGFPDGTFKPDAPVDRAEFAAMLAKAFDRSATQQLSETGFSDVPENHWAMPAIKEAYEAGFLNGYPNNQFKPDLEIPKVQAIVALANGLNLQSSTTNSVDLGTYYTDASTIPEYAVSPVTAATQAGLVVNYPNVNQLNPEASLTRAEAAALLYQALVQSQQATPLPTNSTGAGYIVGGDLNRGGVSNPNGTTPTQTMPPTDGGYTPSPTETMPPTDGVSTPSPTETIPPTNGEPTPNPDETVPPVNGQPEPDPTQTTPPTDDDRTQTENEGSISVDIEPRLNYVGIGGNIGLGGDSAIGEGSFAAYSKIGLTRNISARPAAAISGDPTILLPVTYDFNFRRVDPTNGEIRPFPVSPFVGGGIGIETSDDADVGVLVTGGVDIPINNRIMLTGTANAIFLDNTDVGLMVGVGYRF